MSLISMGLTTLSLFTFWLVIPMFLLPPLAFFFGYKKHRANQANNPTPTRWQTAVSVAPMVLAVVAFVFEFYVFTTGYRP